MKKLAIICIIILAIILGVLVGLKYLKIENKNTTDVISPTDETSPKKEIVPVEKVDIVDLESKTRPLAVSVNNTPVAVKVQTGLNDAYMVYTIPTEGSTSRLLALYKDADKNTEIGTIRSGRHNFIDYALESSAILCCYGWSHYAEDQLKAGAINYIQGLFDSGFYRNNPEKLASEHTAFTTIGNLTETAQNKKFKTTVDNNSIIFNYNVKDVNLDNVSTVKTAKSITIPYSTVKQNTLSFEYNEESKMYTRFEGGNECLDYKTKEPVTTKNIIVQKVDYSVCSDGYYWDLKTIGSGKGYYITNGNAVEINWKKDKRTSKTIYTYAQGTIIDEEDVSGKEITLSDGKTWIAIQVNARALTIE